MATKSTYPYYNIDDRLDKVRNAWLDELENGIYTKEQMEIAFNTGMLLATNTIRKEMARIRKDKER